MLPLKIKHLALLAVFVALAASSSASALEQWADDALPVKKGLELWLDASRENAGRIGAGMAASIWIGDPLPRISPGGPVDVWHDGSGKKRDVVQVAPEARPRLIQGLQGSAVRFDGKDDFLMASGFQQSLSNLTIFIQA